MIGNRGDQQVTRRDAASYCWRKGSPRAAASPSRLPCPPPSDPLTSRTHMPTALEFLEKILPSDGYKCATVFNENGKVWNTFFPTVADLARFITSEDALGRTVYHACATFGTPESRKQSNAIGARSFWLDIDAGEGKPYADALEAALAVERFRISFRLPAPVYVGSGNGLHCYWPLEEIVQPVAWHRYASGLKRLCHQANLQADGSRTCDLASELRTPGTHNRKHGEYRLVEVGHLVGPYDLSQFNIFLEGEVNGNTRSTLPVQS